MELDWLQTFVVAAHHENFRRAAEQLHLAQPTITLHIAKLEQRLGISLFQRTGRHVVLSPAGRRFLAHATGLLEQYQVGREDMIRFAQGYQHTVRIAVSPLVATTVLPRWIRRFSERRSDVEFVIQVKESEAILDSVSSGSSDLGLSRLAVQRRYVRCEPLYADPVTFVAPSDANDIDGPVTDAAEVFRQYPVLTHNHPEYWDGLLLSLRNLYPVRILRVSQVHVTIQWIAEKMGVSFLPASTVRRELLRGSLIEVPFHEVPLPIAYTYLVTEPDRMTGVASDFADFVRNYMRDRDFWA